jgi:nucleotide-binding universal stress UspA family protein
MSKFKILVPVDFSEVSDAAVNLAIDIAKKFQGTIHLYHAADIPDDWEYLSIDQKIKDTVNNALAFSARDRLISLKEEVIKSDVPCKYHYSGGKFYDNINEIANTIHFDLIVIGSHGISGKKEWFMGSNAQKVLHQVDLNCLVVKHKLATFDFSKVMFLTSGDTDELPAFKKFLAFIRPYRISELHIASIKLSGLFWEPSIVALSSLEEFKTMAGGYHTFLHYYPDYSVEAGARHLIEELNIDLLSLSYREANPIRRALVGSNVEMVINHLDVPVLTIHDN